MDKFANIEALVSVVDAGGFGKAAERLGIAKSVVSRRVGALEAALGVQLLQRTTRTQSLTTPGRQFYEQAVRILGDLEEAEQSVSSWGSITLHDAIRTIIRYRCMTLLCFAACADPHGQDRVPVVQLAEQIAAIQVGDGARDSLH